jgi:hypothetical protein
MAKMFPPQWQDVNGSHAEGVVYRKLRDETPDDWLAVHSLGLSSHRSKPWAEIDFVVVGPFGVLCLEVKGGSVRVEHGRWTTNGQALKESPFSQAGGGSAALNNELRTRFPSLAKAVVAHGVVFPDVTFEAQGAGIDNALVYDDRDLQTPMREYLERLGRHWHEYHGRVGDRARPLSRGERNAVLSYLAPSFDLVPTLRARLAHTESELIELTRTQGRILRGLRDQDRALIRGGAGTGKTLLAVEEATRFAAGGRSVLVCCRSHQLAAYISELLGDPAVVVRSYEELLRELVTDADRWGRIPDADPRDVLHIYLPEEALESILQLGRGDSYDVLVLDEAQDLLLEGALDAFDLLLKGGLDGGEWRIFLDQKQNVFSSVDLEQLDRIDRHTTSKYQLVDNCRNTPQVSATTAMLSAVAADEVLASDGPEVETRFVLERREEAQGAAAIVRDWLKRGVAPEDIVVVAMDEQVAARVEAGWPVDAAKLVPWGSTAADAVRIVAAAAFKGLEAAAVVVVGARELHERETLQRMYVACSRARVLLGVVLDEDCREDFNLRAVEHARRGMQTVDDR